MADPAEDTRVEETQDISEEQDYAVDGGEEASDDTGQEDSSGSLDEFLDGIDLDQIEGSVAEHVDAQLANRGQVQDQDETEEPPPQQKGVRIVHRGEEIVVPEEKVQEYLQKGYDYDQKVGPHHRLAELLEMFPDEAKNLNQRLMKRISGETPEVPGNEDGEGDGDVDPYTRDQFDRLFKQYMAPIMPTIQQTQAAQIHSQLQHRDGPELFKATQQAVMDYAEMLAAEPDGQERLQRLNSDPQTYMRVYETQRARLMKAGAKPRTASAQNKPAAKPARQASGSFRMSAGNRREPEPKNVNVWDIPSAEFESIVTKLKGF